MIKFGIQIYNWSYEMSNMYYYLINDLIDFSIQTLQIAEYGLYRF